ncbi:MAG: 3-phosphoserine/phosphohydroxythreonine transaminase [Acidobacteriota bacterium]
MTSERIYNFSPGPATLPEPVLQAAQEAIWNVHGSGIGILEHSHRGPVFDRVIDETEALVREVAGLDDAWQVLFLQGGATLQFAMVPMTFLSEGRTADYLDTGSWVKKAIGEAKKTGSVHVAFSGKESGYDHVPANDEIDPSANPVYTWYCSNNTIAGTQYHQLPTSPAPLVCDASSDILSRPLDLTNHGMVVAGAQKNIGVAGCTLVLIRKDWLEQVPDNMPLLLDYRALAAKGSRLNTPPTFGIWMMGEVLRWIRDQGGVGAIEERNRAKAALIYDAIDGSEGFYRPVARDGSRSMMNVTFRTPNEDLDRAFLELTTAEGLAGLKGHRSVGGLRASIYNAFPEQGCRALTELMGAFAARHAT